MKRVNFIVFFLVMLTFVALSATQTMAAFDQEPYSSYCQAQTNYTGTQGDSYAYASDTMAYGYAEAKANFWTIGARSVFTTKADHAVYGFSYMASAQFTQEFKITGAGSASIIFSYDGSLEVNDPNGSLYGDYRIWFDTIANDDRYNYSEHISSEMTSPETKLLSGTIALDYYFSEEDIGNVLLVTLTLNTGVSLSGVNGVGDETQSATLISDFYNTASLETYSGGLAPVGVVPIPGAIWLFGSGVIGLVAMFRKQDK